MVSHIPTTVSTTTSLNNLNGTSANMIEVTDAKLVYSISMVFLLLLSLLGNSIVLFAVLMSKRLTDRSTFYFVSSLACSDMDIAIFTVPFRVYIVLQGTTSCLSVPMCYIFYLMTTFGNIASILNLFLVSTDRFVAVHMPYKYPRILSNGRSKRIISCAWITAAVWALSGTVRWAPASVGKPYIVDICAQDNSNYHVASFGFSAVVLLAMSVQYVNIMQVVLRQIRQIEQNTPKFQHSPNFQRSPIEERRLSINMLTNTDQAHTPDLRQKTRWPLKSRLRREIKATKSIVLVFLAFCLCWLPGTVFTIILSFVDEKFFLQMNPTTSSILFFTFVDIFPTISTMVNPIIYSFSNTHFRCSVEELWRKLMKKAPRRLSVYSTTSNGARTSNCTTSSTISSRAVSVDENAPLSHV